VEFITVAGDRPLTLRRGMGTPPFRDEVDIGEWNGREPEELLTDPALVEWVTKGAEAAYALTYAHHGSSDLYDEIGFRVMAATLGRGEVPLKTRVSARRTLAARRWAARDPESAKAVEEQENLRHRPIEPPDGQLRTPRTISASISSETSRTRQGGRTRKPGRY